MTIDKARAKIEAARYSSNGTAVFDTAQAAEITLAAEMSVLALTKIEVARQKLARYRAEWELAALRMDLAQKELKAAEAASRGETQ